MENEIKQKVMEKVESCHFFQYLGIHISSVQPGEVIAEVPVKKEFTQQLGMVHGGFIATLADSVAGFSALSLMPAEKHVVTVELKVSFLRAVKGQKIKAIGKVIKPGSRLHFCEVEVWSDDALCAKVSATMMVV